MGYVYTVHIFVVDAVSAHLCHILRIELRLCKSESCNVFLRKAGESGVLLLTLPLLGREAGGSFEAAEEGGVG